MESKNIYFSVKRIFDFSLSFVLIIVLIPLFLVIIFLIIITMGFPVFFSQERAGLNNRIFRIYKFRTMRMKNAEYSTDEQRITWVGRKLRIFRIDELPQLFNIFLGDMSFIGPRPLMAGYIPYYSSEEIRRHNVRPGLSGYSQVGNLNYPKWEEQFEDDIYYVDNISFKLDLIIFYKTLLKIVQPSKMTHTGVVNGRINFDAYRKSKQKSENVEDINS